MVTTQRWDLGSFVQLANMYHRIFKYSRTKISFFHVHCIDEKKFVQSTDQSSILLNFYELLISKEFQIQFFFKYRLMMTTT